MDRTRTLDSLYLRTVRFSSNGQRFLRLSIVPFGPVENTPISTLGGGSKAVG